MKRLIFVLFAAASFATPLAASPPCQDGAPEVGWLGITELGDKVVTGFAGRYWFQQEPRVDAVAGPARGKLRPGDVITAIDGYFITTRRGSLRLIDVEPGERMQLGVRRAGEQLDVEVRAGSICPEDLPVWFYPPAPPAPPAAPVAPVAPVAPIAPMAPAAPRIAGVPAAPAAPAAPMAPAVPAAPMAPVAPVVAPLAPLPATEAWFGFGFECDRCGMEDGSFYFTSPPRVYSLDPEGPAAAAGLARGDVLTHVDGEPLISRRGARRFSTARPGTRLRLTYRRGSDEHEATILAHHPPRAGARTRAKLRYAGTLGSTDVEVRGLDSVHVTVDEERGTLSIRTLDATIHLSLSPERKDGAS